MKIWVTRQSAFGIQCGGLDRLQVWFRKPTYMFEKLTEADRDNPFGNLHECEYGIFNRVGWQVMGSNTSGVQGHFSFGKVFGYTDRGDELDGIASFVWKKLGEHFQNAPFDEWDKVDAKEEDFLLELDLSVSLIQSEQ